MDWPGILHDMEMYNYHGKLKSILLRIKVYTISILYGFSIFLKQGKIHHMFQENFI